MANFDTLHIISHGFSQELKSSFSKAQRMKSEGTLAALEHLHDARTPLADIFSILPKRITRSRTR